MLDGGLSIKLIQLNTSLAGIVAGIVARRCSLLEYRKQGGTTEGRA